MAPAKSATVWLQWLVVVGLALAGIGATVMLSAASMPLWALGAFIVVAGSLVALSSGLIWARATEEAKLLAKRKSFVVHLPDGSFQRTSYGYIVHLSRIDRTALLSGNSQMRAWYHRELRQEMMEIAGRMLGAGRLEKLWLRIVLPARYQRKQS